jgi:hypothetical protein
MRLAQEGSAPGRTPAIPQQADGGLAAALRVLADSSARQGALLEKLMGGRLAEEIRLPETAPAAPKAARGKVEGGKEKAAADKEKPLAGGTLEAPEVRIQKASGRKFVVTSAQNNTFVHADFIAALEVFCAERQAELLIPYFTYNKNAWGNSPQRVCKEMLQEETAPEDIWYDPAVQPYACNRAVELAPGLILCGELDILPTAVDPLSGLDGYTRSASGIVPHAKVAMKSLATMKDDDARFMYATGACTLRNYISRKAGQKAEFHHVFGALYVEADEDGAWFCRHLIAADDGSFHDLNRRYTPAGSEPAQVEAIVWGDIHREKCDEETIGACWDAAASIVNVLRPRNQVIHDLTDFTYRNHHNLKSPYFLSRMREAGTETVRAGMVSCAGFLERIERPWCSTIVVESNHDQAFLRWLEEADGHRDPANAEYWHTWNARVFRGIREGDRDFLVFEEALREHADLRRTRFLREDESCVLCPDSGGIEVSLHGHRGSNGSRGSPRSYRQMGRRTVSAHTHSAGVIDGVWTAGVTGRLNMEYNKGPSSWSQSHVVIYESGKRAIITMRGTRWRAKPAPKPRVRVAAPTKSAYGV